MDYNYQMQDCVFCKIVAGELPSQKEYEDDLVLGFRSNQPSADTHILFIPKNHVASLRDATDATLLGKIMIILKETAEKMNIRDYKVIVNNGQHQSVPHMHFHLLGGTLKGVI